MQTDTRAVDIGYPLQRSRVGQAEGLVNEQNVPGNVALGQPSYLPFPDHVNRFVTCNRPLRPAKGSKSLFVNDPSFNGAVVLLNDVVQIRTGSAAASPSQSALPL